MSRKSKKEIIENGIRQGVEHFGKYGKYNFKNKSENPLVIFGNIMTIEDITTFSEMLRDFIFNKYKDVSLEDLKIQAVKRLFGVINEQLINLIKDEAIESYVSLDVINKINDIYKRLNKQSEIVFKELEIEVK